MVTGFEVKGLGIAPADAVRHGSPVFQLPTIVNNQKLI